MLFLEARQASPSKCPTKPFLKKHYLACTNSNVPTITMMAGSNYLPQQMERLILPMRALIMVVRSLINVDQDYSLSTSMTTLLCLSRISRVILTRSGSLRVQYNVVNVRTHIEWQMSTVNRAILSNPSFQGHIAYRPQMLQIWSPSSGMKVA